MLKSRLWIASAALLSHASALSIFEPGACGLQQPIHFASNISTASPNMTRASVIALSHGGGPMPVLGDPSHKAIVRSLKERVPKVLKLDTPERPRAIVLVTAHWSERNPTISSARKHALYYDYYGFPPETYNLKYDAPGSPEVAQELYHALQEVGFDPQLDDERGWDHGVFIPMLIVRPAADIPIVQMSVLSSEDPEQHFRMGLALRKLRDSNVAVVGSGFASFHNLRLMFSGSAKDPDFKRRNQAWNDAIDEAVKKPDEQARLEKLKGWRQFPGGYEMHPRGKLNQFSTTWNAATNLSRRRRALYASHSGCWSWRQRAGKELHG